MRFGQRKIKTEIVNFDKQKVLQEIQEILKKPNYSGWVIVEGQKICDLLLIKNTKQVVEKVFNQNDAATYSTTEQKTFQIVVAIDILKSNESPSPHTISMLKKMTTIHYIADSSKNIENFLQRI